MNNNKENTLAFIQQYLVKPVEELLATQQYYPLLIYCSLGIETIGAFLDNKPLRARKQSKLRFGNALYQLFPKKYSFSNKGGFLYEALRNHSAHNLIPSSYLIIYNEEEKNKKHLSLFKEKTFFCIDTFAQDFLTACQKISKDIEDNKLDTKLIQINSFTDN